VLSILGIVGVFPTYLAAIAVIGLGAILPCSVSDNHHSCSRSCADLDRFRNSPAKTSIESLGAEINGNLRAFTHRAGRHFLGLICFHTIKVDIFVI
jgi:hypothetical protein